MSSRAVLLACVVACASGPNYRRSAWEDPAGKPPKDALKLAARPLTASEQRTLDQNGFAILGYGRVQSFHVGYTALFHAHSPVYITADSLLYAWHSSYDKILIQVENGALIPAVESMLDDLRAALPTAEASAETRADLDVYLAVAASLAKGKQQPPVAGGDATLIGTLYERAHAARQGAPEGKVELFGYPMELDFSMFKPRGHYTRDVSLRQYFQTMSWLGRAEIRIAARRGSGPWRVDRRALRASALLGALFTASLRARWQLIDSTIGALVGPADSMSLPELASGLDELPGIDSATDAQIVAALHPRAVQKIRTQLQHIGDDSIAFLLLGQRFVADAGVMSDLVADSLKTDPPRLMPTPLDVAYAVLHNQLARALLAFEVEKYGAPYERALAAQATRPLPADSVAHLWLTALRELSPNAERDARLPAPLTTESWSRRLLATQLASWAELRHDNLLYTKQSFTLELGCEYPDAYVDPYPAFYAAMATMANRARAAIATVDLRAKLKTYMLAYFDGMAKTMARLGAIAERERANQPLTADDLDFINHMVSLDARSVVCAPTTDPHGWYAELFYEQKTALWHDPVIADVHTQPTDEAGNMVGHVLHVGTSMPRMMAITIRHDSGEHAQTYRGFVSTYAELVTDGFQRMTDEEWRKQVDLRMVTSPSWLEPLIAW